MQHFVDCIAGNKQPLVGLEDGYKAVQWALVAKKAVAERKVVEIK
jgi:predicted dehydrogenase